jgi:hypothetical protein
MCIHSDIVHQKGTSRKKSTQRWAEIQVQPEGTGKISLRMKELNLEEQRFEAHAMLLCWEGLCTYSFLLANAFSFQSQEGLRLLQLQWGVKDCSHQS